MIGERDLRCRICRAYVDAELSGLANQPFEFYFKFHIENNGRTNTAITSGPDHKVH